MSAEINEMKDRIAKRLDFKSSEVEVGKMPDFLRKLGVVKISGVAGKVVAGMGGENRRAVTRSELAETLRWAKKSGSPAAMRVAQNEIKLYVGGRVKSRIERRFRRGLARMSKG